MGNLFNNYEEACAIILFGIGFTTLLLHRNMIKKIIGFSMMDSAIYLFLAGILLIAMASLYEYRSRMAQEHPERKAEKPRLFKDWKM